MRKAQESPHASRQLSGFDESARFDRADARNMAAVLVVGLLLRAAFFLLSRQNNPVLLNPIMDGLYHHEWAQRILAGNFWGDEVFFRAPLYPYFLALLYKISGSSIGFAVVVQQLIGVGSSLLVYLLARQFFVAPVSLLAGLLAALYWPFVYFEGDLLIVTLIVFLDGLALVLLVKSVRRRRYWLLVLTGLILGVSAVARPSVLVFLPAIPFVLRLSDSKSDPRQGRFSFWLAPTATLYLGTFLAVAPVLVRNYVIGHDIVPIASQGGVNFYIGNNPRSDGRTAIVPGTRWDWWGGYEDAIRIAETDRGRKLKPSEVSNYYFAKGLGFLFGSPQQSIPLTLKKFGLFWAGGERSNNKYIYFFWRLSGLGNVPLPGFWFVAPIGLLGAVLLWPQRRRLSPLYLFVVMYMFGVIVFFVNARFRLPVVPVLIIFGAYALYYLWTMFRRRHPGAWKPIVVLALGFLIVDLDFLTFKENKTYADSISHYTLGNAYLKMGDPENAIAEYETAIRKNVQYPTPGYRLIARNVDFNLGKLLAAKGSCELAVTYLQRVGGNDQYAIIAKEHLAGCYYELLRFADAAKTYEEVLQAVPDHPTAKNRLARSYAGLASEFRRVGDDVHALEYLERARELAPDDAFILEQIEAIRSGR